ncbi:hypothetical protein [Crenothrix sp.]|uniref:hypothetical protein n=1 Tax=Crenothrix sp. TaxID=3100433 RepID=UPI00374D8BB1
MHNNVCRKLATFTLFSTLIPTIGFAAPHAMLEKAKTYALDSQVRAFQVPTVDNTGKIKYYDMTINLTVKNDGSPNPIASVVAKPSPIINAKAIVAGTYKSVVDGTVCKAINMTLTNGRIQSFFTCPEFEFSLATGGVTATHPYFPILNSNGITKRSDINTQAWGNVTSITSTDTYRLIDTFHIDRCKSGWIIGAKTDGKTLILSAYGNGINGDGSFQCTATFTKQP